jgi:hypothetical protein
MFINLSGILFFGEQGSSIFYFLYHFPLEILKMWYILSASLPMLTNWQMLWGKKHH